MNKLPGPFQKKITLHPIVLAVSVCVLTAFLIFIHLRNIPYSFDDSYIHFRIASNFVITGYPYFNANEPVMVSSSSAWTLILYVLFSIWGPRLEAVAVFNAISCIAGAILYYRLFREIYSDMKWIPAHFIIPVAYISILLPVSLGLMETSISLAVCGLALLLLLKNKKIS